MNRFPLLLLLGVPALAPAQLHVPVAVELNSPAAEERQVLGLAAPLTADAAVSVDAARNSATTFVLVSGQQVLRGNLVPVPGGYAPGMLLIVVSDSVNASAARIDLNALGELPLLNQNGLPLDSASLMPGVPAKLVHDGSGFRVISSTLVPCPSGFYAAGREYCIEVESRVDTTFYGSVTICRQNHARLCTMSEWVNACTNRPDFMTTVLNHEWVDSAANNTNGAKRVGYGTDGEVGSVPSFNCIFGGWAAYPTGLARFRCCKSR